MNLEALEAGGIIIGALFMCIALSLPVAFAFILVSVLGMWMLIGSDAGIKQIVVNGADSVTNFALVPVPMFFLMGELFFRTGLAVKVFDAFDALFGNLKARLSYVTIAGGTTFAALTGTSMGNTALLGSLMIPEMEKRGYKLHMSVGPIIATGGLGMIIPPSSLAVLLGSIARIDIGKLLIAGLGPGLLLALLYAATVWISAKIDPDAAPEFDAQNRVRGWALAGLFAVNVLPMAGIVVLVVAVIIFGIATPSEAAAFGVLGVLATAALFRCLTLKAVFLALKGTLAVTAMMLLIIIGSSTFSQILAISGATQDIIGMLRDLEIGPYGFLAIALVVLFFLGMLMDPLSIMLLTIPILFPLVQSYGFDPIWFGIVMLLMIEISMATPPFGLGLFVMLGVAPKGTTLGQVVGASIPYIGCDLLCVILITIAPPIVLFLPGLMN
ncbi:MAG: TRAP transporter large permease subunit [Pseudomonadota bacterium]